MRKTSLLLATLLFCQLARAEQCAAGDELSFNFQNLNLITAFSILADFSKSKLLIDESISWSGPIVFGCLPWRKVAQDLADQHNLKVQIRDGLMYVSKK